MISRVSIDSERLDELLAERSLSKLALAELSGANRHIIGRATTTRGYSPSLTQVWRIAAALDVPVTELLVIELDERPAATARWVA